jgi:hypothetical protein
MGIIEENEKESLFYDWTTPPPFVDKRTIYYDEIH